MRATTDMDPARARRNSMIDTIMIEISAMVISPFRSFSPVIPLPQSIPAVSSAKAVSKNNTIQNDTMSIGNICLRKESNFFIHLLYHFNSKIQNFSLFLLFYTVFIYSMLSTSTI